MRKIPTVFARDFDHDPRYVTRDVTPGCEWVLKGIVWHHPDGRMAKLKSRDFPR